MEESDDGKDVQPKPKRVAKMAGMPVRPRPISKNSQRQAKVPNVADRRDLTNDKGSSKQKSNRIRKSLFLFFLGVVKLLII
jgi:hypothetical protein